MGTISFTGLASGLDTQGIVSSMVSVAKIPMNQIKTSQGVLTAQSKKITDIKTKLAALQTAAKAIDSKGEALGNKVSSSNDKILTATAQGGSSMGTFKVDVTSLAQAERTYSDTFTSDSTAGITQGKLTMQVGTGDPVSIDVTAEDTLATIAKKIGSAGIDVSAGVFHDGTSYRLQVTGTKSGAANNITFTEEDGLSLGLSKAANEKQVATDAVVSIDGMQVRSATNAVTGAVPGVTLNVADLGSSVVKVDRDSDGLKAKLDTFITAYNDVMKGLNTEFSTLPGTTKSADSLSGDSTLRSLQTTLRGIVSKVTSNGSSALTTFSSLGVTAGRDGTLSLDATKYAAAVAKDYDGVASLLAGRTDGGGLMSSFATGLDRFASTDGALATKIKGIQTRNKAYDAQLVSMQARLDKYETGLNAQFSALEQTMAGLQSQGSALASILTG